MARKTTKLTYILDPGVLTLTSDVISIAYVQPRRFETGSDSLVIDFSSLADMIRGKYSDAFSARFTDSLDLWSVD